MRGITVKPIDLFRKSNEISEKFFPPGWFLTTKDKGHPAYVRWSLCNRIIGQNGKINPIQHEDDLPEIGRIILYTNMISSLTDSNPQQLKREAEDLRFDSLQSYGDDLVRKKILSRIGNRKSYEDLMVELYVSSWNRSKNYDVIPLEKEGYPDMVVKIPEIAPFILVECKRIRTDSVKALSKKINKANTQIKYAKREFGESSYGLVVLDISNMVGVESVVDDSYPKMVDKAVNVIRTCFNGGINSSTEAVILVWQDHVIFNSSPNMIGVGIRFRKVDVFSEESRPSVLDNSQVFGGYTAEYYFGQSLKEVRVSSIANSYEWLKATYANLSDPGSFAVGVDDTDYQNRAGICGT